ncbi:MAG: hypothetical protein K9J76_06135 [Polaromonas sp.]|nr:hypothetical protein [Polaromonas sp.]
MTLLAAHPKLPVMHIRSLMARNATAAHRRRIFAFGRDLFVTPLTLDFAV